MTYSTTGAEAMARLPCRGVGEICLGMAAAGTRTVTVDFDFLDHELYVRTSDGETRAVPLVPRTVADFYADVFEHWLEEAP